jgi:hypothetical protein
VAAINPVKTSDFSAVSGEATLLALPGAPRELQLAPTLTKTDSVGFQWVKPETDGGSSITKYNVFRVNGDVSENLGETQTTSYQYSTNVQPG